MAMNRSPLPGIVVATALALGCSAREEPASTAAGSTPRSVEISAEAGSPEASPAAAIWKASSRRIELSSFGFMHRPSAYAKDRAELTPAQLAALAGLQTMSLPTTLGIDAISYKIRVLDDDGTVAEFRAATYNVRDTAESSDAALLPTIDFATLEPFLETFRCLTARDATVRTTETPVDPSTADMQTALAFPTDSGCTNAVFLPDQCSDTLFTFDVGGTETYDIVSGRCLEAMTLRLYASDRTTLLAESTPATTESCFVLRHTFEPGSYVFVLTKTNAAGCNAKGEAGTTSLRLRPVR